jgi:hypothetical protein
MNRRRLGSLVATAIVVLVVGIVIGARLTQPTASRAPAVVLPTAAPTATPVPTPTTVPVPHGLGTRYYESDNAADGRIALQYVGDQVVARVTYDAGLGANPAYTGTVTGTTLTATAPSLPALENPRARDVLVIRIIHPGEAEVTLRFPNNSSGTGAYSTHFPAVCGRKTDAYPYQSCQALVKP